MSNASGTVIPFPRSPRSRSVPPPAAVVTRFAPSPTGYLHLGHAYAALVAYETARQADGRLLLRIEDIDSSRCRPEFEQAIYDDLAWLGLTWQRPVRRQSGHFADYARALERLRSMGLLYSCFCTRKEIREEIARSPNAPHGVEGPIYPGTCRRLSDAEQRERRRAGRAEALRLDIARAMALADLRWDAPQGSALIFEELGSGPNGERGLIEADPSVFGDVVLARKDVPASYHLAVTVDDALQDVTLVTRGQDLFPATFIHRLLQAVLKLPTPLYLHHRLVSDESGQRLAKRAQGRTLRYLRDEGATPADIRRMLGFAA